MDTCIANGEESFDSADAVLFLRNLSHFILEKIWYFSDIFNSVFS